jgi:hypothetical protein
MVVASITAVHLGAAWLVGVVDLSAVVRAGLWIAVTYSFISTQWRHGLRRGRNAIVAIRLDGNGAAAIQTGGGDVWRDANWRLGFSASWGTAVSIRQSSRLWPQNLFIAFDAIDVDVFRELRVRLKARSSGD